MNLIEQAKMAHKANMVYEDMRERVMLASEMARLLQFYLEIPESNYVKIEEVGFYMKFEPGTRNRALYAFINTHNGQQVGERKITGLYSLGSLLEEVESYEEPVCT